METATHTEDYAYSRGEEVLAHLAGTEVYHVQGGGPLGPACIPAWTIGEVMGARCPDGRHAYLLRFPHDEGECLCWVSESSIEGVC